MKIGGFGRIQDYRPISGAGYDYAELDMPEIEALNEAAFSGLQEEIAQRGFPVRTGARLLPIVEPTFMVEGFRPASLAPYLKKSCARCAALGIGKVILGNGKARTLQSPEDIRHEPVFVDFLRMTAEIAGENGQELILEPLGPKYSNYLNTLPEAVRVIELAGSPNLFAMVDLRHMVWSEEPLEDIAAYRDYVHHAHVDFPTSFPERGYPCGGDGYDYSAFLAALAQAGYDDTLTIEADIPRNWNEAYRGAQQALGL